MSDCVSLLPPNSTNTERAIECSTARIGEVPVPIRSLWNPATCPAELLPWLAWAFSVDNWSDEWSEAQKRGVIAAAYQVHRRKGTPAALQAALDGLGYEITLTEWFQEAPAADPCTFYATVTVDQTGLPTLGIYRSIIDTANSVKNARSHMTGVAIQARTAATEYMGAVAYSGDTVTIMAEPV